MASIIAREPRLSAITISPEVGSALAERRPVVALESTIISHGLPQPRNLEVARELEDVVRESGACPATIAVIDGRACVGLSPLQMKMIAVAPDVRKLSSRDLAIALASGSTGATTVSATSSLAALVGIRVFATGGLGGVHRGWIDSRDESADLATLSETRITVISAGVKSILDVPATLQRLETLNVAVVGYRTNSFPGFYLTDSGETIDWRVDSEDEVATIMRCQDELEMRGALVVAQPVDEADQLDRKLHDRVLLEALSAAKERAIQGQQLTPFLLDYMVRFTDGASLEANLAAVRANVRLAGRIAVTWCAGS